LVELEIGTPRPRHRVVFASTLHIALVLDDQISRVVMFGSLPDNAVHERAVGNVANIDIEVASKTVLAIEVLARVLGVDKINLGNNDKLIGFNTEIGFPRMNDDTSRATSSYIKGQIPVDQSNDGNTIKRSFLGVVDEELMAIGVNSKGSHDGAPFVPTSVREKRVELQLLKRNEVVPVSTNSAKVPLLALKSDEMGILETARVHGNSESQVGNCRETNHVDAGKGKSLDPTGILDTPERAAIRGRTYGGVVHAIDGDSDGILYILAVVIGRADVPTQERGYGASERVDQSAGCSGSVSFLKDGSSLFVDGAREEVVVGGARGSVLVREAILREVVVEEPVAVV